MGLMYLRHPIHGEKVESNSMIASMDLANGWVEFDPAAAPDPVVVVEDEPEPAIEKPKRKAASAVVPDFLK